MRPSVDVLIIATGFSFDLGERSLAFSRQNQLFNARR
jgi:hypothetical protein